MRPVPCMLVALTFLASAGRPGPASAGAPAVHATPPAAGEGSAPGPVSDPRLRRARVPPILLRALPRTGGIPRMAPEFRRPGGPQDWERHDRDLARLRANGLSKATGAAARVAALAQLRAMTDPAAFESMCLAVRGRGQDAALAALDAFAAGGEAGQHALASVAVADPDAAIRAEATRRIAMPPSAAVLAAIDDGLRSEDRDRVDRAGILAGSVHAIEAIPALIFAQVATGTSDGSMSAGGDRAWIAVGKTRSYVQNVVPVTGDNSGAFQPVIGQVIEGVVLRVQDCAVTIYQGGVHDSLVAMSSLDSGMDTASLGWDIGAWVRWFDGRYVPQKVEEDRELAALAGEAAGGKPPAGR